MSGGLPRSDGSNFGELLDCKLVAPTTGGVPPGERLLGDVVCAVGQELQSQERMGSAAFAQIDLNRVSLPFVLLAHGDKVDGEPKYLIARRVLNQFLGDIPDHFQVGFRVFGHMAFWGNKPPYWKHLPGELSEQPPTALPGKGANIR